MSENRGRGLARGRPARERAERRRFQRRTSQNPDREGYRRARPVAVSDVPF